MSSPDKLESNTPPSGENRYANQERLDGIVRDLANLLDTKCPETFNKQWIKDNDRALYARAYKYARRNGGWLSIKKELSPQWQDNWTDGISAKKQKEKGINSRKYTLEEAAQSLNKLLKEKLAQQKLPKIITSQYIEKTARNLFRYFEAYVRLPEGGINWDLILSHPQLDPEVKTRFLKPQNNPRNPNIKNYANLEEAVAQINTAFSNLANQTGQDNPGRLPPPIRSKDIETMAPQAFGYLANHYKNENERGIN